MGLITVFVTQYVDKQEVCHCSVLLFMFSIISVLYNMFRADLWGVWKAVECAVLAGSY